MRSDETKRANIPLPTVSEGSVQGHAVHEESSGGVGTPTEAHLEPVMYPYREPHAFARLLASVSSLTDTEPDETFTDLTMLLEGAALIRRFEARVQNLHCGPAADRPGRPR